MKALSCLLLVYGVILGAPQAQAAPKPGAVETRVKTLFIDPESQSPIIVLEALSDKRTLPIWINVAEARAIALELEHVTLPRPLTHDLIRNLLTALGATLQRVTITELRDNTYFARLSLVVNGRRLDIDCRPSDAIAIALRMKAPIFASTQVLSQARSVPLSKPDKARQAEKTLGIQTQDLTAELAKLLDSRQRKGVLITEVKLYGAAMQAGLSRGDIITKVDARPVSSADELEAAIRAAHLPGKITLDVIKKGKPTTLVIDLP